ncbi:stealth conserved region 3 domain-containing protein [Glutamicibacter protophormiae]|uniref:Capsular polysaccharide phosphotransferase SacB n=1 Tax=Glutamicibacter protophormiae TaxID=37930 RepID=A0ABS4XSG7_GLUPR|nr:stealth conserved region 3 domain-containing protein [Glutamicibacter protophormiae]MBP2399454.1 hypothetical protein [Glutamicibacter protophormiae]
MVLQDFEKLTHIEGAHMITGWRGKIGRMLPDDLYRHLLNNSLKNSNSEQRTISEIRFYNENLTTHVANNLKIDFTKDRNSTGNCIQISDWQRLRKDFEQKGLVISKLSGQHGYAAVESWSVRDRFDNGDMMAKMDLRGLGAIWHVYASNISAIWDAQDFVGKVDAVYTWVDSSDQSWQEDYQRSLQNQDYPYRESVAGLGRFKSRDELLFSLRSLELNMPWINHVYLVTAGQAPQWLAKDHPKLTLVSHEEIFENPSDSLPTFNSHAIEANLSNIPGLREHFIYVNDDVFFGKMLHPNAFYGPVGQTKFSLSNRHFALENDVDLPVNQAARNNRNILIRDFDRTVSRKFKHVAHPQRKTVHEYLKDNYPEEIKRISRQKFRGELDLSIPSSLAHHIAARLGLGYSADIDYQYLEIGSDEFYLDAWRFMRLKRPSVFCINEVLSTSNSSQRDIIVRRMLESIFPLKSSYEF